MLTHTQKLPVRLANHFGNIEIKISIEDLKEQGICFGDSVSVIFSNGFTYHDIPYYNSFLGPGDKPCLYGIAQAYEYVGIGYPVSGHPWNECGASEGDFAIICLSQKETYLDELHLYGITIQANPGTNMSTEQFANFRPLIIGNALSQKFYRCANPLRQDTHCSSQAQCCVEKLNPGFIINLSDTYECIDSFCQANPQSCYAKLREHNALIAPCSGVDFRSVSFAEKAAGALSELIRHPGPYLIHCRYGVDRTGFLCVLLEALLGTSLHAMACDYMISYKNVYGISEGTKKYQAIQKRRFGEITDYLSGLSTTCSTDTEDALKEDSLKKDALKEGALREGALREGALREDALREGSLREGALREGALREDALREGSLREDALREGALHYLLKGGMTEQAIEQLTTFAPLIISEK